MVDRGWGRICKAMKIFWMILYLILAKRPKSDLDNIILTEICHTFVPTHRIYDTRSGP